MRPAYLAQKHPTLAARSLPRGILAVLVTGAMLLGMTTAQAAGTPEQRCQAAKNKIAGKYAACRQNVEVQFATSGDELKHGAALTKCESKFTSAWLSTIAKAAAVNVTCLDAPLTESDFQTILAESADNIADALAGLETRDRRSFALWVRRDKTLPSRLPIDPKRRSRR